MNARDNEMIQLTSGIFRYPKVNCIYQLHGTTIQSLIIIINGVHA